MVMIITPFSPVSQGGLGKFFMKLLFLNFKTFLLVKNRVL